MTDTYKATVRFQPTADAVLRVWRRRQRRIAARLTARSATRRHLDRREALRQRLSTSAGCDVTPEEGV